MVLRSSPRTIDPAEQNEPCGPDTFRWSLSGSALPPLSLTLNVGEAVRAMVYAAAERAGLMPVGRTFHSTRDPAHRYAFWLPEDDDDDGFIDYVTVFAESGFPLTLLPAMAAGGELRIRESAPCRVVPERMGRREPGRLFGPGRSWRAVTPHVTPWWRSRDRKASPRQGSGVDDQLRRELHERGLPGPRSTAWAPEIPVTAAGAALGFLVETKGAAPGSRRARSVSGNSIRRACLGPLALGFGAHFGLDRLQALPS